MSKKKLDAKLLDYDLNAAKELMSEVRAETDKYIIAKGGNLEVAADDLYKIGTIYLLATYNIDDNLKDLDIGKFLEQNPGLSDADMEDSYILGVIVAAKHTQDNFRNFSRQKEHSIELERAFTETMNQIKNLLKETRTEETQKDLNVLYDKMDEYTTELHNNVTELHENVNKNLLKIDANLNVSHPGGICFSSMYSECNKYLEYLESEPDSTTSNKQDKIKIMQEAIQALVDITKTPDSLRQNTEKFLTTVYNNRHVLFNNTSAAAPRFMRFVAKFAAWCVSNNIVKDLALGVLNSYAVKLFDRNNNPSQPPEPEDLNKLNP